MFDIAVHFFLSFFFIHVADKLDADAMDEKRKEHVAYEYLCHLEEAKKLVWQCPT